MPEEDLRSADETTTYARRLRDLEAQAFRTARTLAEHSEQLATTRARQHTASGNIGSSDNTVGEPGEHTIAERLDTIERVLFAVAHAQDIDPAPTKPTPL